MTDRQPSLWAYFPLAYEDAYRVFSTRLPTVLTLVAGIMVVGFLGGLVHRLVDTRLGDAVLDLVIAAITTYLIAPYLFALYRAVARNEEVRPEAIRPTPEAQRFAAWSVVITLAMTAPLALYTLLGPYEAPTSLPSGAGAEEQDVNLPGMLLILGLLVAAWIFTIRTTTLPALLALDPDRASLPAALAQTRGQFWFIVGVQLVTMLPIALATFMLSGLVGTIFGPLAPILLVPLGAALTGFAQVMVTAVSTRLYQRFAALG